jgi:prepilin-type N-terminal cleavage/methylation domain-containing protein
MKGITLLELLVAITIASIVLSLAFFSFTRLNKDFFQLSNHSVKVQDMVVAKAQVDAVMKKIKNIKTFSENRVEYMCCNNDSVHVLEIKLGKLFNDAVIVNGKINNVKFSMTGDSLKKQALLWEGTVEKNGWIGGAVEVRRGW